MSTPSDVEHPKNHPRCARKHPTPRPFWTSNARRRPRSFSRLSGGAAERRLRSARDELDEQNRPHVDGHIEVSKGSLWDLCEVLWDLRGGPLGPSSWLQKRPWPMGVWRGFGGVLVGSPRHWYRGENGLWEGMGSCHSLHHFE